MDNQKCTALVREISIIIIMYKWHSLRVNTDIDGEVNYPVNISSLIMTVTNTVAAVH